MFAVANPKPLLWGHPLFDGHLTVPLSKQQAMKLAGATSNQLQYLERANLVVPTRTLPAGKKKPEVFYTWQQVLQIRAIRDLRESLSLKTIRLVLDYVQGSDYYDEANRGKQLVAIDDAVLWVSGDWSDLGAKFATVLANKPSSVGQYSLTVIPTPWDVIDTLRISI